MVQNQVGSLEPPSITLCPGEVMNNVKMKKLYGLTYDPFVPIYNTTDPIASNVWKVYNDSSYILNRDVYFHILEYELKEKSYEEKLINLTLGK